MAKSDMENHKVFQNYRRTIAILASRCYLYGFDGFCAHPCNNPCAHVAFLRECFNSAVAIRSDNEAMSIKVQKW